LTVFEKKKIKKDRKNNYYKLINLKKDKSKRKNYFRENCTKRPAQK